ncbi:MAG: SRPBCC domain-containing protein [Gemmatimonadota bacterium]
MNTTTESHRPLVNIERVFAASPEEVFDAWLDLDLLRDWFCGGKAHVRLVEVDPQVGGAYRIVMSDGEREWDHSGTYLELDRPRRLVFTWHTPSTNFKETLVTVTLEGDGDGTRLRLRHESLPADMVEAHHKGWAELLEKLAMTLA